MFLVSESHGLGKNKLGVNDVQYLLKTDFSPQSANFEQYNATCHGQDLGIGLTLHADKHVHTSCTWNHIKIRDYCNLKAL